MSDDELRDGFGREIESVLAVSVSAETSAARQRVRAATRKRRIEHRATALGIVIVLAVTGVAVARHSSKKHVRVAIHPPPVTATGNPFANLSGIVRVDVNDGKFVTRIVTDPARTRVLVEALRAATPAARSTLPWVPWYVTLHRRDGSTINLQVDANTGSTGKVQLPASLVTLLGQWYTEASRYISDDVALQGVAIVRGTETWLYDDAGHQVSVLPTPLKLPGYDAPPIDGSDTGALSVRSTGSTYVLERWPHITPPHPPNVPRDCDAWSVAGQYTAAVCSTGHRAELIGPSGTIHSSANDPHAEGYSNPIASTQDGALFTKHWGDCSSPNAVIFDANRSHVYLGATGIGWSHGEAIIAVRPTCGNKLRGVYIVDPTHDAMQRVIPDLPAPYLVYRWYWPGAD